MNLISKRGVVHAPDPVQPGKFRCLVELHHGTTRGKVRATTKQPVTCPQCLTLPAPPARPVRPLRPDEVRVLRDVAARIERSADWSREVWPSALVLHDLMALRLVEVPPEGPKRLRLTELGTAALAAAG